MLDYFERYVLSDSELNYFEIYIFYLSLYICNIYLQTTLSIIICFPWTHLNKKSMPYKTKYSHVHE